MPTLYGRHLIGNTIFLSLKDVAADLPAYDEHPTPVRMSAELEQPYREMEADLKEAVAELLRRGNHQLLSAMLHALLAYPDYPYDWKPVGYVDKSGAIRRGDLPADVGQQLPLAEGEEAAGDPAAREGPGPTVLGLLRLHQHPSRAWNAWRRSSGRPGSR